MVCLIESGEWRIENGCQDVTFLRMQLPPPSGRVEEGCWRGLHWGKRIPF